MDFSEIICGDAIDLSCSASSKDSVLRYMAEMLYKNHAITSVERFISDVYDREKAGSTGIGDGIAIPHGKSSSVVKNCISICRIDQPIEWETIDEKPVSLVILFAVMRDAPTTIHLKMMSNVAGALADPNVCDAIKKAQTPDELIHAFNASAVLKNNEREKEG